MLTRLSIAAIVGITIFFCFQASQRPDPCAWNSQPEPAYACAFAGGMK